MSIFKAVSDRTHNDIRMLRSKINYVRDFEATEWELLYGGGVSIGAGTFDDMMEVKNNYNQAKGKGFFHYIFGPEEGEINDAAELYAAGVEIAQSIEHFLGWYQVLMAVHTDHPERLHIHFIVNNIDLTNGGRLDLNKRKLYQMKNMVSEIAEKHGISPVRMYRGD